MPREDRRARMAPLRTRVQTFDVHRWVGVVPRASRPRSRRPAPLRRHGRRQRGPARAGRRLAETDALLLLLDYDGTLVPFTPTPELARPDARLLALLRALAARPDTKVHVVSGRPQQTLRGLARRPARSGSTPSTGFSRGPVHREWVPAAELGGSWREPVLAMLREIAQRTPGSLVEVKTVALAWHYRMADQETGARRANELRLHLTQLLSNQPVEMLPGDKVIEIRQGFTRDGSWRNHPRVTAATMILAIGDDRTDEDLFAALPPEAITIRVGPGKTKARFRLESVPAVRALLPSLVEAGVGAGRR